MNTKAKEWIRRYLPAELLSVTATVVAAVFVFKISNNAVSTALAATWAGNIAYFGTIILKDILKSKQFLPENDSVFDYENLLRISKKILLEFGMAEILDSFLIRPALMFYLPIVTGNLTAGILLAKFTADITFYIPAIIGYEISKKRFLNNT